MTYQATIAWSQKRKLALRQWRAEYLSQLDNIRGTYLVDTFGMADDDPKQQIAWERYCIESNTLRMEYIAHGYEDGGSMPLTSP